MNPTVTKLLTQPVQAINPCGAGQKRQAVSHAVDAVRLCIAAKMMKKEKDDEKPRIHVN